MNAVDSSSETDMPEGKDIVRSTPRILLAKPGLDGHDRGAKVLAHALGSAGFEVIYTGLHQSVEMIVAAAIQEAVDVIGLSIMSGAHVPICRKLFRLLRERGMDDVLVLVGGVVPKSDIPVLKEMGVAEVFPGGSDIDAPAAFIRLRLGWSRETSKGD
jgi:methylmalonyl-CoA mutase, C-terminal domain